MKQFSVQFATECEFCWVSVHADHLEFLYNGNHYKILIKILQVFLNRSTHMIKYHYDNGNLQTRRSSNILLIFLKSECVCVCVCVCVYHRKNGTS